VTRAGRRAGLVTGVLLAIALQWGCSGPSPYVRSDGGPRTEAPRAPGDALSPPRSDRGNPPFYDVLGKRYHVLPSSEGYRARGVASWYGRDFHGLATSSGETYNMHDMTAAHTTLPIPTWVEVTNLANNKRVIVKVNDRGPFVDNRIIDLSYAAALQLDIVRNGTARVEVRALGAAPANAGRSAGGGVPGTTTASNAPPARAVPSTEIIAPPLATAPVLVSPTEQPGAGAPGAGVPSQQLFVQVGAFGDHGNAARLVQRLEVNGFVNAFVVTDDGRRALHRVRIGPLRDAREFDQVRARLRSLGFGESQLVTAR
jgi:rare lipoprotein A